MDLESTLATIETYLPEQVEQVIEKAVSYIPEELSQVIWHASSYLPTDIDWMNAAEFMLYFTAASLILGIWPHQGGQSRHSH